MGQCSVIALAVIAAFAAASPAGAEDAPVRVAGGVVSGAPGRDPAIRVFKGLPFAAPPVGDLRWRAPRPVVAWSGVRKADQFGANCMQSIVEEKKPWTYEFMAHGPVSEDCLFLNVWTGARRPRRSAPSTSTCTAAPTPKARAPCLPMTAKVWRGRASSS